MTEDLFLWNSDGKNTEGYHNWYCPVEPNNTGDCNNLWGAHNFMGDDFYCSGYDGNIDGYFMLCQKST